MSLRAKILLAAMAAPLLGWTCAAAAMPAAMETSGRTTQPVGHYHLCQELPAECRQVTAGREPVELTRALWAAVVDINNTVNIAIEPATDMEMWGQEEIWSYPGIFGDCEDYALEKRRRLMALGVPAGSVLITVVRQPNGDWHAVLTLRTDLGDFILDNLEPRVLAWMETQYQFLKRQSDRDSGVWVSIDDGRAIAVGSVR
jgi:predicted transglutaminase-like cysteine proteinase